MKANVLIVHNYYRIPGGEDTVVANEKKLLEDNGHKVIVYKRHNDEIEKKGMLGKILLPIESIFSLKTYREIRKVIKKNKIDIIHVHNTLPLISPSVYHAAKSLKKPIVQTIHNFRFLCPAATFVNENKICEKCTEKGLRIAIKNKCYRNSTIQTIIQVISLKVNRIIGSYKKVDKYIALTDFNKEKLSILIDKNKIEVKPNFQNYKAFEKREIGEYYLFVGRIDELKGIELLIKAWKKIENRELLVIGTGPKNEYLKEYIKSNNLSNIKFLGFKEKKQVMEYIKGARAIIVPSQWYEGFPMTIVESMSYGIPIVGSNVGNVGKIIKDRETGLLFQYNEQQDLVRAIEELEDDTLVKYLKKKSIREFKQYYTATKNYEKLKEIYIKCMEENK